jgi:phosphosulfolactate synthase (CoM biosynthesis protein A)
MLGPGFLDLPSRSGKPRRTGITHVLDRGLPLAQATDLLERCESYVDVWKFDWGIAYLDPQLAPKLDLLARFTSGPNLANVAPDGALGLETFRLSLRADTYRAPAPGAVMNT